MLGQEKRGKKKKAEETVAFANPSQHRGKELQTHLPALGKREALRRTREYCILTNLLHALAVDVALLTLLRVL